MECDKEGSAALCRARRRAFPERRKSQAIWPARSARLFSQNSPNCFPVRAWMVLTRLLVGGELVAWNYGFSLREAGLTISRRSMPAGGNFLPGFACCRRWWNTPAIAPDIELLDLGLGEEDYKNRFATISPDPARDNHQFQAARLGKRFAILRLGGKASAPRTLGAPAGWPSIRGKRKSMRAPAPPSRR